MLKRSRDLLFSLTSGGCQVRLIFCLIFLIFICGSASAHFGAVIPSDDIVTQLDNKTLHVDVKFIHPMEGHYMEMEKPQQFGVLQRGKAVSLLDILQPAKGGRADQGAGFTFWQADFLIKRPGDYTFFTVPKPYWEPAEDKFIVHYSKVCINALGMEDGWDQPVGLEIEIVPLTRPYGLWTNNLFSGQVLLKGQPLPFAKIEIEYLNESEGNPSPVVLPADAYVTQVLKADANGVFHYAMPRAGWWGFSALSKADRTLAHDGKQKSVEIGAVYWVHTRDML